MEKLAIKQIREKIAAKEISLQELVRGFLEEIEKRDKDIHPIRSGEGLQPSTSNGIHAFLEANEENALEQAGEIDAKIAKGEEIGVLAGVPVAIKDNILTRGFKCTAGSKILENYDAPYDATVIRKLKDAGAIILGKTNLDEFAMGSSTENSAFGPTKNPLDATRVPGGSSGGSAAAVAAGMCVAALGSDTGGSIRQPAAFCGVVGFKPTYGAVSRYGLIAMASSLDQIGPFANSVEDAQTVFDTIRGKDSFDATSLDLDAETKSYKLKAKSLKIGIPKEYFGAGIDAEVKSSVEKAIKKYEANGAKVEEISLPHTEYGIATYQIIMASEVSANLARYDGIRFGKTQNTKHKTQNLLDHYLSTRQEGFGSEVKRRIMLGTHTLSSGYYDAYYLRAQKVRALIKQDFDKAFLQVDVIITPATPTLPFKFGEKSKDPVSMYLSDIFTVGVNLAGFPAIVIPCDWIEERGKKLPVGLQIIGKQRDDYRVLAAAELYEKL